MPTPSADEVVHAVARVSGQVQGVGFRWWTMHRARDLGVAGSAVNLPDGSVEVHAEGGRTAVDTLLVELRRGPPSAKVTDVSTTWQSPAGLARFDVG
jgi:acylphosphatase